MAFKMIVALTLAAALPGQAVEQQLATNPIRKVVTMLQMMVKKVEEEGEKEKELYQQFMCYCKNSGGDLDASIATAEDKVPAVSSDIKSSEEKLAQAKEDLKSAQEDRSAAKTAMAEARAQREKEAAAFAETKAEYDTNIAAIAKAVTALEKGMAGGFLQTGAAQILRRLAQSKRDMNDGDRQALTSFLSGPSWGAGYSARSGEITGILKKLGDEMAASLADFTSTEEAAIKTYEGLIAAKTREVAALTAAVEAKTKRIGELGVAIVQMKEDRSDTEAALAEDQAFRAELEKGCQTKTAEWEERSKTRGEELVALADTIKVLNDDDALDLFKKVLPSASASFMQLRVTASEVRLRALAAVRQAQAAAEQNRGDRTGLDLLALALTGKKALSKGGFDKVLTMIDEMVKVLKAEQLDDDHKKEYCALQFDQADDKKKALERTVADEENAIATAKEAIATTTEDIAALEAGIAKLDKAVAEATEQRKQENVEFKELMASDSAAKEVLGFAKNRLNKFYNAKLYKPPPKRELTREERIFVNQGGTPPPTPPPGGIAGTGIAVLAQVSSHATRAVDAPAPPPSTWGAYAKKGEESTGVIAMIDLLIKDISKEMTEAETGEKEAQADYEAMMMDSADKRTTDSKSLSGKASAKADMEADLTAHEAAKTAASKELMATLEYIQSLRMSCDWLIQYFDVRKEARAGEMDALTKAKAILSGAGYSLLQTRSRGFLQHRA